MWMWWKSLLWEPVARVMDATQIRSVPGNIISVMIQEVCYFKPADISLDKRQRVPRPRLSYISHISVHSCTCNWIGRDVIDNTRRRRKRVCSRREPAGLSRPEKRHAWKLLLTNEPYCDADDCYNVSVKTSISHQYCTYKDDTNAPDTDDTIPFNLVSGYLG